VSVDLEQARERLMAERERVCAELDEIQEDLGTSLEDATDEDGIDSHLADSATETLDREVEQGLEDNAEHLLAAIDAALKRVEEGTYGICERCGKPIDDARLEALPYATKCIECKRLEEQA
jgi:DnaK suppressor protein